MYAEIREAVERFEPRVRVIGVSYDDMGTIEGVLNPTVRWKSSMSRNTEYQFVPTDTREVEARMIASYAEKSKQTVRPASPERLFIDWVASALLAIRVLLNYTGNQNIPSRSEELNLDALGSWPTSLNARTLSALSAPSVFIYPSRRIRRS